MNLGCALWVNEELRSLSGHFKPKEQHINESTYKQINKSILSFE